MRPLMRELAFAFLAWLIPFAASVCIFSLKTSHPPLFDSLMGIVLTSSTVVLGCLYLLRAADNHVFRGARVGATWAAANWVFDGLMFSGGPMKMEFGQYVMDIGIAYLVIPVITIGLGTAAHAGMTKQQAAR